MRRKLAKRLLERLEATMTAAAFAVSAAFPALAADDKIVVGFATAESGFMQAYDEPATQAALVRIDEIAYGANGKPLDLQIEIRREDFVGHIADIIGRTMELSGRLYRVAAVLGLGCSPLTATYFILFPWEANNPAECPLAAGRKPRPVSLPATNWA